MFSFEFIEFSYKSIVKNIIEPATSCVRDRDVSTQPQVKERIFKLAMNRASDILKIR